MILTKQQSYYATNRFGHVESYQNQMVVYIMCVSFRFENRFRTLVRRPCGTYHTGAVRYQGFSRLSAHSFLVHRIKFDDRRYVPRLRLLYVPEQLCHWYAGQFVVQNYFPPPPSQFIRPSLSIISHYTTEISTYFHCTHNFRCFTFLFVTHTSARAATRP